MKKITTIAAGLTLATIGTLAAPALAAPAPATAAPAGAAPAAAAPAGAAPAGGTATTAEQLQGVSGTRLVFRNTTDRTLMLYCPDGGVPLNTTEYYMATLAPGQEYTFTGYNSRGANATDVYVRVYTVKKNDSGAVQRDTMVATVGAHNPAIGYPFVRVTAGTYYHEKSKQVVSYKETLDLSEHETHDSWRVTPDNKFRAWIHRDGDVSGDDYKTLKVTLQDIDTVRTLDMQGGGAAPA